MSILFFSFIHASTGFSVLPSQAGFYFWGKGSFDEKEREALKKISLVATSWYNHENNIVCTY